jgi:hypothetical protein
MPGYSQVFVVYVHATLSGYLTSQLTMGKYPWLSQSLAPVKFFPTVEEALGAPTEGIPGFKGKDILRVQLEPVQSVGVPS